jgi:hypothetical protein
MHEVIQEVEKLLSLPGQGWKAHASHDMERASFGFTAWRHLTKEGKPAVPAVDVVDKEEVVRYEWLPFGRLLTPTITIARTAVDFASKVKELRSLAFRCDKPESLQMGYASYDPKAGTSQVVRVPLAILKSGSKGWTPEQTWMLAEVGISIALAMAPRVKAPFKPVQGLLEDEDLFNALRSLD